MIELRTVLLCDVWDPTADFADDKCVLDGPRVPAYVDWCAYEAMVRSSRCLRWPGISILLTSSW